MVSNKKLLDMIHTDSGYILLSSETLMKVCFYHLLTGIDSDTIDDPQHIKIRTGYTEWASNSSSKISIGWDWALVGGTITRTNPVRSNLKIQAYQGSKLGLEDDLANKLLSKLDWQVRVEAALK